MKNVCVVLKKNVTTRNGGECEVIDAFNLCGYPFEEIRFLLQANEKKFKQDITDLKENSDNILVLADRTALPIVKGYLLGVFSENAQVVSFANATIYEDKKCSLFLLSSDGSETGLRFVENVCKPYLAKKHGVRFEQLVVRSVGASEEKVSSLLIEAERISADRIRISHHRKYCEDVIGIVYDSTTPKMLVDDVVRVFAEGLSDTVYALNDVTIEEQLVEILKLRKKKISVAESFTGGGIARRITSVSGASAVYFEGVNTYDERSKIKRLGVSELGLRTVGAVSDQTAYEMALGLLNSGDCDIAIATTGLAGPKSDRSMLPVGLCFIAVGTKEKVYVYRYKFDGDRTAITEKAINYALFTAFKQLKNM